MTREQIEQLPAGRELDALIAEKVMGWVKTEPIHPDTPDLCWRSPESESSSKYHDWLRPFSTDIAEAWKVIDQFRVGKTNVEVILCNYHDDAMGWCAQLESFEASSFQVHAPTPAHAICLAALLTTLT